MMPHASVFTAAAGPAPPAAGRGALRARLRRTGLWVVGGSVFASVSFTHLCLILLGELDYAATMIAAVLIPLAVASLAFRWIAGLTLQLEAARAERDRLAHQDPLTGLANRRAALAKLESWVAGTEPLALAVADLDHFKRINDRLGHEGGDASLVHFAAMLRKLVPPGWLIARIGGEEFLLAARGIDPADFAARIEAVRTAIAITPLITTSGPWHLTASFGIAARSANEGVDRLISRADAALYAAKEGGRNRTERAA
ncbi:GGDEF domain-containing protein [Erythrobacter tepidarius]|uniref:GGDEF domain-containing protein n=1 Tax=Erythrobacter tepidarius TaxID=60454 RepID=UPI00130282DA|nr:GGDEF domain-containing protein [Erythrobacter tepidarius]